MSLALRRGFRACLPVALAVVPFGLAYGTVAAQTMPRWQVQLMSLTVFAGTAQFVAASMLAQGAGYLTILLTGLLVNLRLILLSAAIVPHVRRAPLGLQLVLGQALTDESFAVSMAEYEKPSEGDDPPASDPLYLLGAGLALWTLWQIATAVGAAVGASLPQGLGLDYALCATLICLLFLLVRDRYTAVVALFSGLLTLAVRPLVSDTWCVLVATLVAATLGLGGQRWRSRR